MSSKELVFNFPSEEIADDIIARLDPFFERKMTAVLEKFEGEKLLSSAQACEVFAPPISKPTLESWSKKYGIKKYTLGAKVFFKRSDILNAAKEIVRYK